MSKNVKLIQPNWPAPTNISAGTTTRLGGVSKAPYDSLNLGSNTGDDIDAIRQNREHFQQVLSLPNEPYWLNQVHGNTAISIDANYQATNADASYTNQPGVICTVLTADCLPILVCNQAGTEIAAIHAGWRSLASGIIENTIAKFAAPPEQLLTWLGPCISAQVYEIGEEVYTSFVETNPETKKAFIPTREHHWLANLPLLAEQRLHALGIEQIYHSNLCTLQDETQFFSYRRDCETGRMASFIYRVK